MHSRIGFSFVEVMVVVTIISILASVLFVSFNAARENARDDVRKTDLKRLQLAIETYKAQNGRYPDSGCAGETNIFYGPGSAEGDNPNPAPNDSGNYELCATDWIVGLVPEFIAELPSDPTSELDGGRGFYYRSDGNQYKLLVKDSVERNFITSFEQEFARCPRMTGANYCNATSDIADGSDDTYAVYSLGDAVRW